MYSIVTNETPDKNRSRSPISLIGTINNTDTLQNFYGKRRESQPGPADYNV